MLAAQAAQAWAALEDRIYPALRCSPVERTLYNHLLRHTLLEGRRMVRRSKAELSRATGICGTAVRENLRALEAKRCLRIRERAKCGLLLEVFPPEKPMPSPQRTPRAQRQEIEKPNSKYKIQKQGRATDYEPLARRRIAKNPFQSLRFRQAIRRRERGRCFYCGSRLRAGRWGLDHIEARAQGGEHTAANAAACCCDCNREKGEQRAGDFLRSLHRGGRITAAHLRARLAALPAQTEILETGKQRRRVGAP